MDKITDFFKEIKDRISNPFISSFIITWLIVHWREMIVLFTFSEKDYKQIGCLNFIDYFESNMKLEKYLCWPLAVAAFYTLVFPIIRNGIFFVQASYKRIGSNWVRKASRGGMIAMNKYISQREAYEKNMKVLTELIDVESFTKTENSSLKTKITELETEKSSLESTISINSRELSSLDSKLNLNLIKYEKEIELLNLNLSKKTAFSQTSLIYGHWTSNKKLSDIDANLISYNIDEDGISELTDIVSVPFQKIKFLNISMDDLTMTMFTQDIRPSEGRYHLYEFTCNRELTRLVGTYDGNIDLVWERIT